jgi:hypothetical protein
MAVASLVLGLVAILFCWIPWIGILAGVIALILGIIRLLKMKKSEEKKGKGMSIAGIITGVIGLAISVIILIIAVTTANVFINSVNDYSNKQNNIVSSLKSSYNVGEKADIDGLMLSVTSVSDYISTNEYYQPNAGNKFIKVNIYAENQSKEDQNISTIDFNCYADDSAVSTGYVSEDDEFTGATIATGKNVSGILYFEVPETANKIELQYSINYLSDSAKVIFNLK